MAAPTLVAFKKSLGNDDGVTAETAGSFTWSAGDVFVVLGITEDNGGTLNTPTATGLIFSAPTPASGTNPTNTASSAKGYIWTATAASSGSGSISSTHGGTKFSIIYAWQYRGSGGIGACATSAGSSSVTISLTRGSANSAVVWGLGDWNATNDLVVAASPAGGTQEDAELMTGFTGFAFDWGDQGTAGTTSYGISGFASTKNTNLVVEIKGTSSAAPTKAPTIITPRGTYFRAPTNFERRHGCDHRSVVDLADPHSRAEGRRRSLWTPASVPLSPRS